MKKELLEKPSLVFPSPVGLISTYNPADGKPNIITLAWIGVVESQPPQIAISIWKKNYSHDLVKESQEFVVNIPSIDQMEQMKICGRKSGRDTDKWKECSFTPVKGTKINAPLIEECPINLECKVRRYIPAEEMGIHGMFIGEVVATHQKMGIKSAVDITPICYSLGKFGKTISVD